MDRIVYLAGTAAKSMMERQDVLAHNLANVSTPGFRAELQAFRAVPVRGDGTTSRVYALETSIGYSDNAGIMASTGRALDVAAKGRSWFAVQAFDGTEAYTRGGAFEMMPDGTLTDVSGRPVVGDGGPITVPADSTVEIAEDGTVSARTGNQRPQAIGKLKLVTPEEKLIRGDDGLFRTAGGDPLPADDQARVASGTLENSNVSAIETMVQMISAARQFEQQMKVIQTAEQKEQAATKLLSANA